MDGQSLPLTVETGEASAAAAISSEANRQNVKDKHIKIVNLLLRLNRILWLIIADKEEVVMVMVDLEPL